MDREHRVETVSARIPTALLAEIEAIVAARGTTLSSLICECLQDVSQRERRAYEKLRTVFEVNQDLPELKR